MSYKIITKFNKFSLNQNALNSKYFNTFNHMLICDLRYNKHIIEKYGYYSTDNFNKEFHLDIIVKNTVSFNDIDELRKEFIRKYDINITLDFLVKNNEISFENEIGNDHIFLL